MIPAEPFVFWLVGLLAACTVLFTIVALVDRKGWPAWAAAAGGALLALLGVVATWLGRRPQGMPKPVPRREDRKRLKAEEKALEKLRDEATVPVPTEPIEDDELDALAADGRAVITNLARPKAGGARDPEGSP